MKATLDHTKPEVSDIRTFYFKPEKPINYQAGQYIELKLPHNHLDERGDKHWFTLSSSPTEDLLSITTRHFEKASTFKQTLFGLEHGSEVHMVMPVGDFVLPKDTTRPLLFVAGGIGITPMRSMVKYLTDKQEKRDIKLLYAAQDEEHFVFKDLFVSYGVEFLPLLQEPPQGWTGLQGKLSGQLINEHHQKPNELVYISGPEPMVETFVTDLEKLGVSKDELVTDYFPGYVQI